MTAFSRYEYADKAFTLTWELRSVNHRYLDVHFRLPESVRFLEGAMKEKLASMLKRGHVDATLVIHKADATINDAHLNTDKVKSLSHLAGQVEQLISVTPLSVSEVLQWPGVIEQSELDTEELEAATLDSLELALEDLMTNRQSEGKRLGGMLNERITAMESIIDRLRTNMPDYELSHQEKFKQRLEKLEEQELDELRLSQEIAVLISKADVSEELDRLESHVAEFANILESAGPVGRRLDFLLQEFNREANTLGSKSIHKEITAASVDLKVLTDQLKEQALNVE